MYELKDVKAVIFDIDGTLLDSMHIWKEACDRYLIKLGIEPDPNVGDIIFTMTIKEGIKYSKEHYHIDKSEEEMEQGLLDTIRDFYYYEAKEKPGAVNLVKTFAKLNIPMVLATTGNEELASRALDRLGMMEHFCGLLTCNNLNTNKGEPLVFNEAVKILSKQLYGDENSLDVKDVCVFEDSLKAIKTVKSMGFNVIPVKDEECKSSWGEITEVAGFILDSLSEVNVVC